MNTLDELLNQEVIDDPEQWFESVCQILFYRTVFHIKDQDQDQDQDQRYQITEAELYLKTDDQNDPQRSYEETNEHFAIQVFGELSRNN